MRPVSGKPPLTGAGWLYELKLDGFRLLADLCDQKVCLRYRSGHVCTDAFPEIAQALRQLPIGRLVLDGEVVVFDETGRPDFDRLGVRLQRRSAAAPPVTYMVFDVLVIERVDVRPLALSDRKKLLDSVLPPGSGVLRAVPFVRDDGRPLAAFVLEHDLEGIVVKRAASPYRAGLARWTKVKRRREEDFLVTRCHRRRDGAVDALSLASERGGRLVPCGVVEWGALRVQPALGELAPRLGAGWTKLECRIVVSVTFTSMTSAGRLREARVKGVRPDALER
jgi:bifunctional non-homologous end joining protein LigD